MSPIPATRQRLLPFRELRLVAQATFLAAVIGVSAVIAGEPCCGGSGALPVGREVADESFLATMTCRA